MITTDRQFLTKVPCKEVTIEEAEETVKLLDQELKAIEKTNPGIGLAANQIGIAQKVAIIRLPEQNINLANCKITKFYDEIEFKNEGCLSIPGVLKSTKRYNEIVVENNLFEPHSFTATGLLAVAIQHEIDHLNNILITEREFVKKKGFFYPSKKRKKK